MMKKLCVYIIFLFEYSLLHSQISFPDLKVEDQTISTGNFVFTGTDCIVSPGTPANPMVINGNANVEYKAGKCIHLAPGFSASGFTNGGKFRAHIVHPFDVVIMEPTTTPGEVPKYEKLELGIKLPDDINNKVNDFSINPNPTKGLFSLNLNSENKDAQNADIIIFDVLGKKVLSKKLNEKTTIINISDQPPGIYFVKLLFNNKIMTCKLIKE